MKIELVLDVLRGLTRHESGLLGLELHGVTARVLLWVGGGS